MKKILLSLLTVGIVAGVGVAATRAFFSDVETSTGNTFTAGTVDLKVDSTATYLGQAHPSATWELRDLVPTSDKFFNFGDIKPGDYGENTVSLHIVNNPAWACLNVSQLTASTSSDLALASGINFFSWKDDGDNVYEPNINEPSEGETPWFTNVVGPASDVLNGITYILADSSIGVPLPGGPLSDSSKTSFIGLAWCAGTLTLQPNGTGGNMVGNEALNCDGSTLGNSAQGGSFSADISFYVEQYQNNPNFTCAQR